MTPDHVEFLSPKQAAHLIGKSDDWLARVRKNGKEGPPWYRIGGRILYAKAEVKKWLESRKGR